MTQDELRRKCEGEAKEICLKLDLSEDLSGGLVRTLIGKITEALLQREMEIEMVKSTLGLSQKSLGEMKQYNHDKREEIKSIQEKLRVAMEKIKRLLVTSSYKRSGVLSDQCLPNQQRRQKEFDEAWAEAKQSLQQIGEV